MILRLLLATTLAAALSAAAQAPATLGCPDEVSLSETIAAPAGWKSLGSQSQHAFERASVYNGVAGGQEYELAPDDERRAAGQIVQTWKLKDYRSMNIFLRCRYHNTAAVLLRDVPANLGKCTLTFTLDKGGNFTGRSVLTCR